MQIIRKTSWTKVRWKNGGGFTHEVVRVPASDVAFDDAFHWRVSVAQIDESGAFSDFPGYHRKMLLLRGAGVRLHFDDAETVSLREVGDMAEFDGGRKTTCELLADSCSDLNLMVRKSWGRVSVGVERVTEPRLLQAPPAGIVLVFVISGSCCIEQGGGAGMRLEAWDTGVLAAKSGAIRANPASSSSSLVFLAGLDDNLR